MEANVPFLASGLTFDALLAAIPFGFVILALIGYVLNARASASQLDVGAMEASASNSCTERRTSADVAVGGSHLPKFTVTG